MQEDASDSRLPWHGERGKEGRIQSELTAALRQVHISAASGHVAGNWPVFSARMIQERVLDRLIEINGDPDVLYDNDLRKQKNGNQINQEITEKVSQLGFERPQDELNVTYIYKGQDKNYADKLRQFSRIGRRVFDCASAINWLTHEAWLHVLGDTHFNNDFIGEVLQGKLSIDQMFLQAPEDIDLYHCARYDKAEVPLPADLRRGDHFWIRGPIDAYAWHPYSQWNGHNVLVDKSDTGEISLVGFASTTTHGRWSSYGDLKASLLEAYNSPLTLRDFKFLKEMSENRPEQVAPFSSWRYSSAYKWLQENRSDAFNQALKLLEDPDADLDQLITGLLPPESTSIRGVCVHTKPRDEPVSREQLLAGFQSDTRHIPLIPGAPPLPDWEFDELIPGFEMRFPHHRQLYAIMDEFYALCTDSDNPSFPGMFLYGDKGTGKTMACKALAGWLEDEGYSVWQADAQTSKNLLSSEEMEEFEALASGETSDDASDEMRVKWMMEKFKQAWEQADVILIDAADSDDVLHFASWAVIRYAKETEGKKFLLTHGIDALVNPEAYSSDWNTFRRIEIADPDDV